MPDEAAAPEKRSDPAWGFLMGWVGRITAIVGLCVTLAGGVTWFVNHHRQQRERSAQLALPRTISALAIRESFSDFGWLRDSLWT